MRVNFSEIPGFEAAIKRENDIRDAAFLDLTTDVFGIAIRQMTAVDFLILDGVGNPIIEGAFPTPEQLTFFLWRLSPDFKEGSVFRKILFGLRCRQLPYAASVKKCLKFIEETFQDSPGGSAARQKQYAGWCAHLVNAISIEYCWSEKEILNTPLKRLFQYLKCIKRYHDGGAILHNPSDKIVGEYLRLVNSRLSLVNLLKARSRGCN